MTEKADKTTVLIVDDEATFSSALKEMLQDKGIEVVVAADGTEGLVAIQKTHPSVVITDLNMPKMGGVELIREARNRGLSPTFVVCTGYPSEASRAAAQELQVSQYFTKPVKLNELTTCIKEIVSKAC